MPFAGVAHMFVFCPQGVFLKTAAWDDQNKQWTLQFSGDIKVFRYQNRKWADHASVSSIFLRPNISTVVFFTDDELDYKIQQIREHQILDEQEKYEGFGSD
jgi:hypothetical protein